MVNLKKEENKRKLISLIKPESNKTITDTSGNIQCENLLSEFEPRIKHPVYTQNQFDALNKQRITYKEPDKFDVLPGPPPQINNYPAAPYMQHTQQQNQQSAKKLYFDAQALFEMARIHNNQNNNNATDNNYSTFKTRLIILGVIVLFILLFSGFSLASLPVIILLCYYFLAKFDIHK